jgi:20S proteasome alpha/beta subunit
MVQWYRHAHSKDMPIRSIARLIQTMLYSHRFFPYYVYNILGGVEEDGASNPRVALVALHFQLLIRDYGF